MKKSIFFKIKREFLRLVNQVKFGLNNPALAREIIAKERRSFFLFTSKIIRGGVILRFKKLKNFLESKFTKSSLISNDIMKNTLFSLLNSKADSKDLLSSKISKMPQLPMFDIKYKILLNAFAESSKDSKIYIKKILNLKDIKAWLNSNEFKKNYASLPYPPLLNPKNIDYAKLPFAFCNALNLPIPQHYNYMFFAFGASAHGTIIDFLKLLLGISVESISADYPEINSIKTYEPYLKTCEVKDLFVYNRVFVFHRFYDYKFACLGRDLPFILVVRDPISRLKTMLNHGFPNTKCYNKTFLLHDDIDKVLDRRHYYTLLGNKNVEPIDNLGYEGRVPSIDVIEFFIDISFCMNYPYTSIASFCQKEVHYIDMSEFLPQNVIESLSKYAKFFNKNLDWRLLEKHKEYLQEKKWMNLSTIIPLNMQIPLNDRILTLHINLKNELPSNFIEISNILFDKDYEILKKVSFSMNSYDLSSLKNNSVAFLDTKMYMQKFLQKLIALDSKLANAQIKEADIIEYFKTHKDLAKSFKNLLDKELSHLKAHRPDIMESWKYYNAFEKIF